MNANRASGGRRRRKSRKRQANLNYKEAHNSSAVGQILELHDSTECINILLLSTHENDSENSNSDSECYTNKPPAMHVDENQIKNKTDTDATPSRQTLDNKIKKDEIGQDTSKQLTLDGEKGPIAPICDGGNITAKNRVKQQTRDKIKQISLAVNTLQSPRNEAESYKSLASRDPRIHSGKVKKIFNETLKNPTGTQEKNKTEINSKQDDLKVLQQDGCDLRAESERLQFPLNKDRQPSRSRKKAQTFQLENPLIKSSHDIEMVTEAFKRLPFIPLIHKELDRKFKMAQNNENIPMTSRGQDQIDVIVREPLGPPVIQTAELTLYAPVIEAHEETQHLLMGENSGFFACLRFFCCCCSRT